MRTKTCTVEVKCKECQSANTIKMGFVHRRRGELQRYLCKDCEAITVPQEGEAGFVIRPPKVISKEKLVGTTR